MEKQVKPEDLSEYEIAFEFFRIKREQEKCSQRLQQLKEDELNLLKNFPFLGNLKGVVEKQIGKREDLAKKADPKAAKKSQEAQMSDK